MTISTTKSTTTTKTRIIISSVGIAVILGLSALLVLPALQNQAFAQSTLSGSTSYAIMTCPNGKEEQTRLEIDATFDPRKQQGDVSGRWTVFDLQNEIVQKRGSLDRGTITSQGSFNLIGTIEFDQLCPEEDSRAVSVRISGNCGSDGEVRFRASDGEEATYPIGSVTCSSTNE
jgi:hypothetical protein